MHPVLDEEESKEIVRLAEKYLKPHQPSNYQLVVAPDGVQQEDEWFYVVVQPSRNDIRSYDYSSRLAEAELDLREKEDRKILLVPALPD